MKTSPGGTCNLPRNSFYGEQPAQECGYLLSPFREQSQVEPWKPAASTPQDSPNLFERNNIELRPILSAEHARATAHGRFIAAL